MSEFIDRVVIVTGAGGGIGRHHALEFARRGARVLVNDLGTGVHGNGESNSADQVVEEIREAGGVAVANYNSVAEPDQAKAIVEQAVSEFGTLDILINNAGILRNRTLKNMPIEDFDLIIKVHLLGTSYMTHAAWPVMYQNGYGRIVLTSSISGIFGMFGQSAYGCAKMSMLGLMNVLALEGKTHNIRVNCLAPGADTRMTALDKELGIDPDNPRENMHPRLISPAALYLSTENAPTGVVIHAMGGSYYRTETVRNEGIELGTDASFEDLLEHEDALLDLSETRIRELP
ncbi:MAG TPA: SDR family NAD(P)-dependent oxidoreductase [Pseudomonadales bacterium]|jgi:NAD(P)-dependent dehydrogenase (short-subunit alcohol dehydrogenase family)|nr:3-oxoacyl-ACP reductase [Gammaproteobacteria bacterium]MDP6026241.1 SDR family NAD(P)-dependent oxidoreductase [Pseudomonadales bacterium]MDP7451304.1 SDR family NAD(P)-dependent oxidoreductase [Arenicellales bacterium]MDP6317217.1 SDR family NAD(P)-dependent oxidoreductase [Pseudomonadales bacterium]MDP7314124.1 SDR family NAD(P)-dependent oxidoreductase [Pseudomonadales bacterium]|tara:strand:- start:13251 stop:14117 length:867 start_codon:yes stop_codon:yes gene_type:complete